jgi:ABC-2 type transport system permease protein
MTSSLRMIGAVALKEARELRRDPITLGVALLLPLVLLFIFGYAFDLDVREVRVAACDLDGTPESRDYVRALDQTAEFQVVSRARDTRGLAGRLDRGEVRVGLVVPSGFARDLRRGDSASVQFLVDGSFSATAQVVAGYLDAVNASFGHGAPGARSPTAHPPVRTETRILYNPSLRSATSIVPGLFGVILMAFPPLLTALAVVREKEEGSIRQVLLSPLPPWAFIVGKLVPYAVLAVADMLLILIAGMRVFGIPLRGSAAFLALCSVVYLLATLGIGLFVSSLAKTQVVALLLVLVITVMPSFMFSGFLYPIFAMPKALQYYTYLFPGRHFVGLARGIFLKGVGLEVLYPQLALLGLYAAVMVAIASARVRGRPE